MERFGIKENDTDNSLTPANVTDGGGAMEHWYVAWVMSHAERTVGQRIFDELGIETYVPLVKVLSRRRDRIKFINKVLLTMYVFFRCDSDDVKSVLRTKGIVDVLRKPGDRKSFAAIPEHQISSLRAVCENSVDGCVEFHPGNIRNGMKVLVCGGPFIGVTGEVLDTNSAMTRLYVRVDMLGYASVEVSMSDIKVMKNLRQ